MLAAEPQVSTSKRLTPTFTNMPQYANKDGTGSIIPSAPVNTPPPAPPTPPSPIVPINPTKEQLDARVSRKDARTEVTAAPDNSPEKTLTEGLAALAADKPKTREQILQEKTEQANRIVDSIRASFNGVIAGERAAGDTRNNRTRALNISSNLQGSDFASAAAQETEDDNLAIIQGKEAERDAKIAAVLSGVPSDADEAYAKATEVYRTNAEAGLAAIKNFRDGQRATATNTLAAIAASGASYDSLQNSPSYSKLLDAFGGDENAVKGAFLASVPAKNKLGSTTVGNKYITFYEDPVSGKTSTLEFELPQNLGPEESVQQVFTNGQVAIKTTTYDAKGNKKESLRVESLPGYKAPAASGSGVTFSDEDKRQLSQAGLANADERTRSIYVNSPSAFREAFARNGSGSSSATPENLLKSLEDWEATQGSGTKNPFE